MKKKKLGFIGCGNMAAAMIKMIFLSSDTDFEIFVCDQDKEKLANIKEQYSCVEIASTNTELARLCDIIVLAVKPNNASEVLTEIHNEIDQKKIVLSIMAGIKIASLQKFLKCKIVRIMPNLNAKVAKSVSAIAVLGLDENDKKIIEQILSAIGSFLYVDENLMDAVTALSGSGPAYVFNFINALIKAGQDIGLSYEQARMLAIDTVDGAAKTCHNDPNKPIEKMIDEVCSKGGTTIEAITVFNDNNFDKIVNKAVEAAYQKSIKLSKNQL